MKRFNKILAVVLVISILASFMGVSVFAADTTNAGYRFSVRDVDGNLITSASEGDIVDLVIAIKTNGYTPTFAINFCYDYVALKQIRADHNTKRNVAAGTSFELLGNFADDSEVAEGDENDPYWQCQVANENLGYYLMWGISKFTATLHKDSMYPDAWGDAEKAQYKCVNFSYEAETSDNVAVPNTFGEYYDAVRFSFLLLKDTTFDSSVFFVNPDGPAFIAIDPDDVPLANCQTSRSVKASNLTVEYEEAPVVTSPVYWVKNQIQWNNKDAKSVNLGVVAGFDVKDIAIDFGDDNIADNVTAVGAKYYLNGDLQNNLTTTRVYRARGGEAYYFRIVLGNISTTTEDTYKIVPYVVYNDGTGEVTYEGTEVEITPTDVARYVKVLPQ